MKPLAFLRKTLGKRENKSTPKVSESTGAELDPYFLESPQSPVWKSGFGEETSLLSFDIQPARKNPIITVDHDHTDNWDVLHAHIVPNLQGKHGSLFHAGAHGPPHNPSHGPPVLNLGRAVRDRTPPRPPRPPSLSLPFEPPSAVPRSPTRVKFAPDPEPRTRAPPQKSFGHFDRQTPVPIPYSPSEDISNVPSSPLRTHLTVSADVGSPAPKIYHRASSSSPHLPLRRPQTEPRGHSADPSSGFSQDALSSFPVQSAPRVRRRPQPLVLASSSTAASFPSSPLISSTDSTPVGTPIIASRSSPRTSRFPGRPRCTPPQYSAPNTLDYPPFFAYFEKILSIPAAFIDPRIVDLNNLNYDNWTVIAYQRTTVILTELVLGAVLLRFTRGAIDPPTQRIISASLFLHPGFLIVDHMHFQYNGFMFGILLWSILMARNVRSFCMTPAGEIQIKNFLSLANAVIAVFVASLGPFILMGQIPQLLSRLFPFTRGLNHAYWAPNVWALVTAADRVLLRYARHTDAAVPLNLAGVASASRGLVGDTVFAVLPTIKPIWLIKLWFTPTYKSFLTALTLCGYTSFLFGWHVHEKAVLLVLVPLSLLAAERHAYFRTFILASVAGVFSLFPLIFTPGESAVKVLYSAIWILLVYGPLSRRVYE
ncbi:hypothetical protein H0H93_007715 [Arthromyces matolae]|nr:hypothetical protein H0H93_007715 [Arthromyces matolae]